jgi:hypothetical protein
MVRRLQRQRRRGCVECTGLVGQCRKGSRLRKSAATTFSSRRPLLRCENLICSCTAQRWSRCWFQYDRPSSHLVSHTTLRSSAKWGEQQRSAVAVAVLLPARTVECRRAADRCGSSDPGHRRAHVERSLALLGRRTAIVLWDHDCWTAHACPMTWRAGMLTSSRFRATAGWKCRRAHMGRRPRAAPGPAAPPSLCSDI